MDSEGDGGDSGAGDDREIFSDFNVILLRKVSWVVGGGGGWWHCNYSYKLQVQVS